MENACFAYIRVSTVRQGLKGSSLQEQRIAIEAYSHRLGFVITDWFEEQETAAKHGRTQFSKMLTLLSSGNVRRVVIHKIDRSARNLRDWADLAELIDIGIEVHFAHETLDLTSRGGRLSADIQAVVAADFIRNLRDEVKKGMRGRLRQGLYPMRAPIGYLDCGGGVPKRPDPVMAPLVRMAFEQYGDGACNLIHLRKQLIAAGLKSRARGNISLNGLSLMLRNPFYYGLISIRSTGETFVGIHEPLISKVLFDEVQDRLAGKKKQVGLRHTYLFQKLLRCASCKHILIPEVQKKRYIYYRCHAHDCHGTCVREELILSQLRNELANIALNDREIDELTSAVKDGTNDLSRSKEGLRKSLRLQLDQVRKRLSVATEAFFDQVIDRREYLESKKRLSISELSLVAAIKDLDSAADEVTGDVQGMIELVRSISDKDSSENTSDALYLAKHAISNLHVSRKSLVVTWKSPLDRLVLAENIENGGPDRATSRTRAALFAEALLEILARGRLVQEHPKIPTSFED